MEITSEAGYKLFEEFILLLSPAGSRAACALCRRFLDSVIMYLRDELVDAVDHYWWSYQNNYSL